MMRLLAWRFLGQHRLRNALSVLAVALGVALTIAADGVGQAIIAGMGALHAV